MTLFDSYSNECVSAVIGVQHTSPKSLGGFVTFFDSYYDDGVIAAFGVQHTSPKSGVGLVMFFDGWMPLSMKINKEP